MRVGGADKLLGNRGAFGIAVYRDNLKALALELFAKCLPDWQVKSAASPRGP